MPPRENVNENVSPPPEFITVSTGQRLRSGVPFVVGFMPARVLSAEFCAIPTFNHSTGKGYQRPPQDARVNELATDMKKNRVDLPTAILLNIRNREAKQTLQDGRLSLADAGGGKPLFYVVDGQHRVLAIQKLIAEEGDVKWGNFNVPFVCMVGATEAEEMEQFYVVNSRAKPVRTDLALALLRKLSDGDEKIMERLEEKGKAWQVSAEKLVEAMAEQSKVWRSLIRLAGMAKGETTMPSASMVTSMKPLLASAFFSRLTFDQQLQVLEAYWRGLREVMRPAFDDPKSYVVQKGVGVIVLHAIMVDLLEIIRSTGRSVVEPEAYTEIMTDPIGQLSGEAQDGIGTPVSGLDFWRIAPNGAAGSYSSSAGRRLLIAKLRQLLPHVEAL